MKLSRETDTTHPNPSEQVRDALSSAKGLHFKSVCRVLCNYYFRAQYTSSLSATFLKPLLEDGHFGYLFGIRLLLHPRGDEIPHLARGEFVAEKAPVEANFLFHDIFVTLLHVQRSAKGNAPCSVNCGPARAYHICLKLPPAFTQLRAST